MEDLKKAIEQMLNDDILKIVISNKMSRRIYVVERYGAIR